MAKLNEVVNITGDESNGKAGYCVPSVRICVNQGGSRGGQLQSTLNQGDFSQVHSRIGMFSQSCNSTRPSK